MQEVAEVLDRLDELGASRERVTVDDVQECLGRDAFGPALLTLGLLALSPVGDIPGAPTILAIFIFGVAVQMAAGRNTPWLPRALATAVGQGTPRVPGRQPLSTGRSPCWRPFIWARLTFLTDGHFARAIRGNLPPFLALTLPPLEIVPFGATVPSSVITGFSIALVARDGLLALMSFAADDRGGLFHPDACRMKQRTDDAACACRDKPADRAARHPLMKGCTGHACPLRFRRRLPSRSSAALRNACSGSRRGRGRLRPHSGHV